MTRNDFIKKIEHGDDIMFNVRGKHFSIFTWEKEERGICICEQKNADSEKYYATAEDLVDNFIVKGQTLAEIAGDVVITDYTLSGE